MDPKLDFIFSRRSIRKYQNRPVPEELIAELLEAGMAAPSAVAKDPWHFIVVRRREILEKIMEVHPYAKMLRQAPVAFIVCGDLNLAHMQELSYMLQDLSAGVENIMIAANSLGLGTCWLGIHPREERIAGIRQLFGVPENVIPMCGIAIGYQAEQPEARTRYRQERVHLDRW